MPPWAEACELRVEMALERGLEGRAGFASLDSILGRPSSTKVLGTRGNCGAGYRCMWPSELLGDIIK